jgi:hypothetical protein
MAIFDFFDKDKSDNQDPNQHFGPKHLPVRGPGGKFVSKKKVETKPAVEKEVKETKIEEEKQAEPEVETVTVEEKETSKPEEKKSSKSPKFKGPFPITFYGTEVRRFYEDNKWYYSIEDFLKLCSSTPPLERYSELKESKKYSTLFKKYTVKIEEVACTDPEGANEILKALSFSGVTFPGPLSSWFTDTANLPYEEPTDQETKVSN